MTMLRFTNMNTQRLDMPIYINKDWIVSVFEEGNGGSLVTIVYGGPAGERWHVQESLNEVIKIIEGTK